MQSHIVRLDTGNTHGWQVRLSSSPDRAYESRLFSDKSLGGKRKARREAEAYLSSRLSENGVDRIPKGRRTGMMFSNDPGQTLSSNNSGRTGVYRGEHRRNRDGGSSTVQYWAASYAIGPDGKTTKRSKRFFFGTKRTEEEARDLAMRFREEWEKAFLEGGRRRVKAFFRQWEQ